MASNEVIELLRNYVALLNTEGIAVYKAYLFGSYSTNTATEFSDIDVIIHPKSFLSNFWGAVH